MDRIPRPQAWAAALLVTLAAAVQALAQPYAYVSQPGGTVQVVDTATHLLLSGINVGGTPTGIAIAPLSPRAYVANDAGYVSVIDTNARGEIARIAVPMHASAIALSPDGTRAYVVSQPGAGSVVSVIATYTNSVIDSVSIAQTLGQVAVDTVAPRAYFSDPVANVVRVLNIQNDADTFLAAIPVGTQPAGLVVDPAGRRLYVADQGSNNLTVIDIATSAVLSTPGAGSQPVSVAINPGSTRLFVANRGSNNVTVFNLTTSAVSTVAVGATPSGVAVTPDGASFVVVSTGSATVSIFSIDTLSPLVNVPVGGTPVATGMFVGGAPAVAPASAGILTGLWWNPDESGWGVHLTQRRNILFAVWFTYDAAGAPKWYFASSCAMSRPLPCPTCVANAICNGKLYETLGPRFFLGPFNPGAVQTTEAGLLEILFQDQDNAAMTYVIGHNGRTVPIRRMAFRAPTSLAIDYTDLWWNPAESGWGLGITQQADTMFLTWFVYDDFGAPTWLVASDCAVSASGNGCSGTLYRTAGPPGPIASLTFDPARVSLGAVGHIDVVFTDGNNGMITYTVDGRTGTKAITRELF